MRNIFVAKEDDCRTGLKSYPETWAVLPALHVLCGGEIPQIDPHISALGFNPRLNKKNSKML
jgi:hypothetical protein